MSDGEVPPWLADFQRGFGAVLRTPLDRSSGSLRAAPSRYDADTVERVAGDAGARLAVYNRQYWFRLFNVLQAELPLVTALTGAWTFNDLAGRFLLAHPPRSVDLAAAADGFASFLDEQAPSSGVTPDGLATLLPKGALVQAAHIDQAFRLVLLAPEEAMFRPSPADAARLARCRLVPSRAFSIVDEDWPLLDLRRRLGRAEPPASGPRSRAHELPAPHAGGRRSWAVCRARGAADASPPSASPAPGTGVATELKTRSEHLVVPLAPLQATLLRHLRVRPVASALALLEAESSGEDAAAIAANVQRWLAESVDLGLWTALAETEGAP